MDFKETYKKYVAGEANEEEKKFVLWKSIFRTIFLPLRSMKKRYGILSKAPWLLPIMWVVRWIEVLVSRPKHIRIWSRVWKSLGDEELVKCQNQYLYVGLDSEEE